MKKILFVANNNALNNSFGAEQRSNVLLHAFLANGFQVDLAYIGPKNNEVSPSIDGVNIVYWNKDNTWNCSKLSRYMRLLTVKMFPISSELARIIDHLEKINHYDYIVCRYIQFASLAGLYKYANKLILDVDDLPAQSFLTNLSKTYFIKSLYRKLMYHSMNKETKRWIKKSKASLFPNKEQAREFSGVYFPNIPVVSSENPVFVNNIKNVLFIGRLDFSPNYEGMDAFIKNCWEIIVKDNPEVNLIIAGKGLSNEYKQSWLKYKNVKILGFVEDILDFYNQGNIVISPISAGAGTNIKVIEALSLGKVCVLSEFSTKGFNDVVDDGVNCLVYKDYQDCITKLNKLLANQGLCKEISQKAFMAAKGKYSQSGLNEVLKFSVLDA